LSRLSSYGKGPAHASGFPEISKKPRLSSSTVQPSPGLEQKTRAFSQALIQEDPITHLLLSLGTGQPIFTNHGLVQLPGFAKLKSMFAKSLQLLG